MFNKCISITDNYRFRGTALINYYMRINYFLYKNIDKYSFLFYFIIYLIQGIFIFF